LSSIPVPKRFTLNFEVASNLIFMNEKAEETSKLETLRKRSSDAELGGGADRLEKQRSAGKMTARERIEFFLDEGTFEEFDKFVRSSL